MSLSFLLLHTIQVLFASSELSVVVYSNESLLGKILIDMEVHALSIIFLTT